jgi:hypothetical protein
MSGAAQRGKTTTGWFYGFKVHLIVNDQGELLAFRLTPGSTDDREPVKTEEQKVDFTTFTGIRIFGNGSVLVHFWYTFT